MGKKISLLLVGGCVLLLTCFGILFSYPFGTGPTEATFKTTDSEEFVSSGSVSIESQLHAEFEATVSRGDTAHIHIIHDHGSYGIERYYRGDYQYNKYVSATSDEEWIDARLTGSDVEVIHREDSGERLVLITKEYANSETIGSDHALVFETLQLTDYTKASDASDSVNQEYTPKDVWAQAGSEEYRITDSTGYMITEQETNVLKEASVAFTYTEASWYGDYLTNDGYQIEVEYKYDSEPGIDEVEPPAWVEHCVDNDDCEL